MLSSLDPLTLVAIALPSDQTRFPEARGVSLTSTCFAAGGPGVFLEKVRPASVCAKQSQVACTLPQTLQGRTVAGDFRGWRLKDEAGHGRPWQVLTGGAKLSEVIAGFLAKQRCGGMAFPRLLPSITRVLLAITPVLATFRHP